VADFVSGHWPHLNPLNKLYVAKSYEQTVYKFRRLSQKFSSWENGQCVH